MSTNAAGPSGWRPTLDAGALRRRASALAAIRRFFAARNVIECDAPVLGRYTVTDPQIDALRVAGHGPATFLQTSPEAHCKRLLAAGSGDVYAMGRVFRDDPVARHHNPEFMLLEWYRCGFDARQLADELGALIQSVAEAHVVIRHLDYATVFFEHTGVSASAAQHALASCAQAHGLAANRVARSELIDFLFGCVVQPQLGLDGPVAVHGYPADQCVQGRLDPADQERSTRFEVFWQGVELANGWQEETDAATLTRRFKADNDVRRALGKPARALDAHLLAAIEHGLPDCAGVALGVDRLLMCAWGKPDIAAVMPFTADRA